jgi:hypothetical protein
MSIYDTISLKSSKNRNILDKVAAKIKTHVLYSLTFILKSCRLLSRMENYGKARQATYDTIICCTHFACWLPKATNTHTEYVIIIAFPRQ